MKNILIVLLAMAFMINGYSQEDESNQTREMIAESDTNDKTRVEIGNDFIVVEDGEDEVNVKVGNKGIRILESLEGPGVKFKRFDSYHENEQDQDYDQDYDQDQDQDYDFDDDNDRKSRRARHFKGHWTGVELGFNNYVTSEKDLVLPEEIDYMTLHSGKSINFNVNFSQLSLGLTRHIGFVTGLGLNWNNYKFDGNNNIFKGANGIIEELIPTGNLEKSKLATIYLTLPFMLEFQLPVNNGHLNIAGGPIGAVKVASHNKMVFETGQKLKSGGDYSLNILRYGATARAGYNNFQLYATYYATPLFRSGKGPAGYDLYPFEIGVAFTFND